MLFLSKKFLNEQARKWSITDNPMDRIKVNHVNMRKRLDNLNNGRVGYDVFLSHSSLDRVQVLSLVKLFNEAGYSVYVDWIDDPQLDREHVDINTANILRERMRDSVVLSYISTDNSIDSKWCPWELGYFDGLKNGKCCILPIVEDNEFQGQEYLKLYPYLQYGINMDSCNFDFFVVNNDSKKGISLREWAAK